MEGGLWSLLPLPHSPPVGHSAPQGGGVCLRALSLSPSVGSSTMWRGVCPAGMRATQGTGLRVVAPILGIADPENEFPALGFETSHLPGDYSYPLGICPMEVLGDIQIHI